MGQKAHPYGLRLGYIKPWKSRWYSDKNGIPSLVTEDFKIRGYLKKKLAHAGVANIEIERSSGRVRVRIHSARPGVIIGRRGQEIDKIREDLSKFCDKELFVDIKEIKIPQIDAQLVAENIATQLEKRIGFRRAMKRTLQLAMQKGALGIKVQCKGRLGGADIARHEKYHEGKVPLSTFRADVDYGFAESHTTYGVIGCKVWIYKGDILVKKREAEEREEFARKQREKDAEMAKHAGSQSKKKAAPKAKKESAVAVAEAPAAEATPEAPADQSAASQVKEQASEEKKDEEK